MGTTLTPNLGLIKPDLLEQIKLENWPNQNTFNMDTIDAVHSVSVGTYTPIWSSSGTNPTLGATVIQGRFATLFGRLIVMWVNIQFGAGFSPGSGTYRISLPVPLAADFELGGNLIALGRAVLQSNSATTYQLMTPVISAGNLEFRLENGTAVSWNETSPITMSSSFNSMKVQAAYLREIA